MAGMLMLALAAIGPGTPVEPVHLMSPNAYRRLERYHRSGPERPVDAARRRATISALRTLRRRRDRRRARAAGWSGTMRDYWRAQWRGIARTTLPAAPDRQIWCWP